jgi:hypothetical protein
MIMAVRQRAIRLILVFLFLLAVPAVPQPHVVEVPKEALHRPEAVDPADHPGDFRFEKPPEEPDLITQSVEALERHGIPKWAAYVLAFSPVAAFVAFVGWAGFWRKAAREARAARNAGMGE